MILNRLNSYGEFLRTIPNEKNINSKDYEMKNNRILMRIINNS